jgi:hypothetical protein
MARVRHGRGHAGEDQGEDQVERIRAAAALVHYAVADERVAAAVDRECNLHALLGV